MGARGSPGHLLSSRLKGPQVRSSPSAKWDWVQTAVLVYFQWRSTSLDLTHIAIDAGLWVEGRYGPSSQNATRLFKVKETGLWLLDEP
jgi:hypothetical protein